MQQHMIDFEKKRKFNRIELIMALSGIRLLEEMHGTPNLTEIKDAIMHRIHEIEFKIFKAYDLYQGQFRNYGNFKFNISQEPVNVNNLGILANIKKYSQLVNNFHKSDITQIGEFENFEEYHFRPISLISSGSRNVPGLTLIRVLVGSDDYAVMRSILSLSKNREHKISVKPILRGKSEYPLNFFYGPNKLNYSELFPLALIQGESLAQYNQRWAKHYSKLKIDYLPQKDIEVLKPNAV